MRPSTPIMRAPTLGWPPYRESHFRRCAYGGETAELGQGWGRSRGGVRRGRTPLTRISHAGAAPSGLSHARAGAPLWGSHTPAASLAPSPQMGGGGQEVASHTFSPAHVSGPAVTVLEPPPQGRSREWGSGDIDLIAFCAASPALFRVQALGVPTPRATPTRSVPYGEQKPAGKPPAGHGARLREPPHASHCFDRFILFCACSTMALALSCCFFMSSNPTAFLY